VRQPELRLGFQLLSSIPPLRYWFVSRDQNELLQVQNDRLIHNWRQRNLENVYPRYKPLRQKFESEIATAAKFFSEWKLGEIACNQCEVAYINLISLDGPDAPSLADIFTVWAQRYSDDFLGEVERGQFTISYLMKNGESGKEPLGRLHVVAQPVFLQTDSRPAIQLTITTRGKPAEASVESAFAWLDKGHEAAVRAFASITTENMHQLWGRTNLL
jgi:uncharacterized protein (TIGR04255 family)